MFSIKNYIQDSITTKQTLLQNPNTVVLLEDASDCIVNALQKGNKVLIAGNGGSAADAQHFAGELVSRFFFDRPGLSAFALTTDTSILTAIGNDYGYEQSFARQVQALGSAGDVLIGISTSGNSKNVLLAIEEARKKGMACIGMTAEGGGQMAGKCDICLAVPAMVTARAQEMHILMGHILCELVDHE